MRKAIRIVLPPDDRPVAKGNLYAQARAFGFELLCSKCKGPLRLVALIKSEDVPRQALTAMHVPTKVPELHPARPPPGTDRVAGGQEEAGESWLN
jgi:hypothetical protein